MKRGTFIFDGVNSEDLNVFIQSRPLLEAPLRRVTWQNPYGVDGSVPFDEGAYGNTTMDLLLLVAGKNVIEDRQTLYNLLDSGGVYKDFIPYFDPGKVYRVMINNTVSFEHRHTYGNAQVASVKFTVKPYKYLLNVQPIEMTTGGTFVNPTNYVAQPLITINGTGAVKLIVNGEEFVINNASNQITIDSERYLAYQENEYGVLTSLNQYIGTREYPIFKPGVNEITTEGDVTSIRIEPKWRSLV